MYSTKDFVCGWVAAAAFPPSFNNSLVVTEDLDMMLMWFKYVLAKSMDKELKADSFGPANVLPFSLPTR